MATIQSLKIVTLSTSCWRATKLHKPETTKVNDANHTKAARVTVRICDHWALSEIRSVHAALYQDHVKLTRPSIQDGMRIIPLGKELEHMETVRVARERHDVLVNKFLGDYLYELRDAPARLNGLYDESAWPNSQEIERKFGVSVRYLGCPDDPSWREWLEESSKAATNDLRDEIENSIAHIAERCWNDGKLHASLFENLRNLLRSVPDYDCGLDSKLVDLAQQAEDIAQADIHDLRNSNTYRTNTALKAKSILDMFGAGSLAQENSCNE